MDKIENFLYVSWLLFVIFTLEVIDIFEKPASRKKGLDLFHDE